MCIPNCVSFANPVTCTSICHVIPAYTVDFITKTFVMKTDCVEASCCTYYHQEATQVNLSTL